MRLSPEQQAILNGVRGPYLATCMRWLVDWGEAMGATLEVDSLAALVALSMGFP